MFKSLRFAKYRFCLLFKEGFSVPRFAGSMLRGAFGMVLRKVLCISNQRVCNNCILLHTCVFAYLFESRVPDGSNSFKTFDEIPRPFIFEPPLNSEESSRRFDFGLILVGKAIDYLPYFIFAFKELEKRGLGRNRSKFFLEKVVSVGEKGESKFVYSGEEQIVYDTGFLFGKEAILNRADQLSNEEITLEFLTPTRIKFEGKLTNQVQFHNIIRALLRRISLLCYFHCGVKLDLDYKGIIEQAKKVEYIHSELHWAEQARYSGRQKNLLKMGGLVGKARFRGELQQFLPLLAAGEWLHVGKGSVMGLGKYVIK